MYDPTRPEDSARDTNPAGAACACCGTDEVAIGEYHMLVDDVWGAAATDGERRLCLGCTEARIGRRLGPGDFTDSPLNQWPAASPGDRQRSHLLGLPGYVLSDADIPLYWSARFLDRLGLAHRYARHLGRAALAARR